MKIVNKKLYEKLMKWPYRKLKNMLHCLWNRLKIRRVPLGSRTHLTLDYALDIVLEPCFRLIDEGYLNHLGPVSNEFIFRETKKGRWQCQTSECYIFQIMVVLVIILTLSVIAILLLVMLPWYLQVCTRLFSLIDSWKYAQRIKWLICFLAAFVLPCIRSTEMLSS